MEDGNVCGEHVLHTGFSIGRNQQNDLVLNDPQVSRNHAKLEITPGGVVLRDLDSGNGTLIDGRRIVEVKLNDNQKFSIGKFDFQFKQGDLIGGEGDIDEAGLGGSILMKTEVEGEVKATLAKDVYNTMFAPSIQNASSDELQKIQRRLKAVYDANEIISSEHDIRKVFKKIMEQLVTLVPANNGVILMLDQKSNKLKSTFEYSGSGEKEIQVSSTIIRRAYKDGEAVLVSDAGADSRFGAAQSVVVGNIASVMCVPMMYNDHILGVLYLDTRGTANAFNQDDLELLVALAGPAAVAIQNALYVDQLEDEFQTTLKLLSTAIEMRDHYTLGHTFRVTKYSVEIAREMGWDDEKLKEVEMGGVLHDVGKIAVADAVLRKPGRLTDEEYDQMKIHPERGAELMKDCKKLEPLIPYCLYHHEKYDGTGYPFKLAGEDIPIEGRVVAVADTFDAMTSNRPYRDGLPMEVALEELEKCTGTQFDGQCVEAFMRAYESGNIEKFMQRTADDSEGSGIICPFCSSYLELEPAAQKDDVIECRVCHRYLKLAMQKETFYGVLMTEADMEEFEKDDSGIMFDDESKH